MNREEIFKKLNALNLDKDRYLILSGASLVVQGFISETDDIDIACDREYYDLISGSIKVGAFGLPVKYFDVFEISYNLYYKDDVIIINGYRFLNIERILQIKNDLGREKDKEVIMKLKKVLNK